jgi:hypothetical protein
MHRLETENSIPYNDGYMHMVRLPQDCSIPSWLVHAQIELDGKRVFVRMVDPCVQTHSHSESTIIGLVVSPVY